MNRKNKAIVAIAISALLVIVGVVLFIMGGTVPSQKIAVSNVSIGLGVQSTTINYGVTPPSVNFTVENLNDIEITMVNMHIDDTSYQQTMTIPPGQSVSTSVSLSEDAVLTRATNYDIEFVFTFADGSSETHSASCTTP